MDDTPFTVEVRCCMVNFVSVNFRCGARTEEEGMAVLDAMMSCAAWGQFILWKRDAGQSFYLSF